MAVTANQYVPIDTGDLIYLPVKGSTTIYQHVAVGDDGSGYARNLVAGDPFRGIATKQADNSGSATDGNINCEVIKSGRVQLTISGLAITDVGKDVYASDNFTFTLTQGSNSRVGKVAKWISSGVGLVELDTVNGDVVNHQHTAATDGGPLTSPRVVTGINDTNGNELFKVTATGSAVNEWTVANAATGNGPSLTATGETNVPATVAAKGTGTLTLGQATGSVQLGTVGTDKIGFYGTTPATQPAHVADPAAMAAITSAALTVTDGAGTNDGTIAAITTGGASADQSAVIAAVQELADQINKLVADVTAAKAGVDANNAAIDSILAQLATLGLQAAS